MAEYSSKRFQCLLSIAIDSFQVEYTLSAYEQNPYAGVLGDVSYRYYSRLFKTLATIWLPNVILGYSIYTWANWEFERCQRKMPSQFANEQPPEEGAA